MTEGSRRPKRRHRRGCQDGLPWVLLALGLAGCGPGVLEDPAPETGGAGGTSTGVPTSTTETGAASTGAATADDAGSETGIDVCPAVRPGGDACVEGQGGVWVPMTDIDSPTPRWGAAIVWTGDEAIVWGGVGQTDGSGELQRTGGAYDPAADTWRPLSTDGAPTARLWHTSIWTGHEMIVWGGSEGPIGGYSAFDDGARYAPQVDAWSPLATAAAPSPRWGHSVVWTGTEMIVWGGIDSSWAHLGDGSRYDPALDQWTPMSNSGAPSARAHHVGLWTGEEMLVWGRSEPGGRYDPAADTWTPMSTDGAPSYTDDVIGVWTGTRALFYNSSCCTGDEPPIVGIVSYDPATDSWATEMPLCTDSPNLSVAVWTGCELLVWVAWPHDEGDDSPDVLRFDGTTTWRASVAGSPERRYQSHYLWTGTGLLAWGGLGWTFADGGAVYYP